MKTLYVPWLFPIVVSSVCAQPWVKIDSLFNPSGVGVQNFSAPTFVDLDRNGGLDLLLGNGSSARVGYFKNRGVSVPPTFVPDTSVLAPIYAGGLAGTNSDYPAVCDLDGDLDYDLIIGGFNGLLFYRNIGDTLTPRWQKDTTVFAQVNTMIGTDAKPAFTDLDGDGDFDLLVGIGESLFGGPTPGITMGYRNAGSRTHPEFTYDSTLVIGIPDVGLNSYPSSRDLDGDGDSDLLIGRDLQTFVYFRNTGSISAPVWTLNSSLFAGIESVTYWKNPTFCDFDRDGDYDLTYGTSDGTLYFYENTGSPTAPQFQYNPSYFPVVRISGNAATVSLADFDLDGDRDMISGDWLGRFQYFRNNGLPSAPRFAKTTANFSTLDVGSYSSPVFVDIDGDGDQDIVSGALDGALYCYINDGTSFTQHPTIFAGIDVGYRSAPALADIDADGDQDMLVGAETASALAFYRNQGANVFVLDNSMIAGVSSERDGHPTFFDLDRDGDYDLILGGISGALRCYQNTGTPSLPAWTRYDALLAGLSVRQDAAPGFADLNGDGKPDVIIGEYNGNFSYYRNDRPAAVTECESIPGGFALWQNYPNPFNPETTIRFHIAGTSHVLLAVYDVLGRHVTTLVNERKREGTYTAAWKPSSVGSGVYFYRLVIGSNVAVKKCVVLK